jgi:hypothetical protein
MGWRSRRVGSHEAVMRLVQGSDAPIYRGDDMIARAEYKGPFITDAGIHYATVTYSGVGTSA